MRTPLGQVRGLGSGKSGTGHFIAVRLTSVALLILTVFVVALTLFLNGRPHAEVAAILASPAIAAALFATVLLTVVHMRIGLQVVIEDYVHGEFAKFAALIANWLFCWGVGLACIFAILKIAFGS